MKILFVFFLFFLTSFSQDTTQSSGQGDSENNQEPEVMTGMVDRHNYWRKEVGVKPLTWSSSLGDFAQEWANHLAKKGCEMEHRPPTGKWGRKGNGENIYWSSGMKNTAGNVVDDWASEIKYYNTKTGKCKGGVCGHYTQVVWKNTTQVGCGMAKCGAEEIWVCSYSPPGNYEGEKAF